MLNVVCVNAGNYEGLGVQYVRTLNDMVRRNLPQGYAGRFVCFTDATEDLGPEIDKRPLPNPELTGWWHKLSLFKEGVFEDDERILFFDLDTLITGRLDALADLQTEFAILEDFFRGPDTMGSAAMAWTVCARTKHIWEAWLEAGSPEVSGGDQAWIETVITEPDIFQDVLPDTFVSYKYTSGNPPEKAAVVVFHGLPRPHQVYTGWVPKVWKEGGITRAELDEVCNEALERVHANIRSAIARPLPWFVLGGKPETEHACIVGGSPSLKENLSGLRARAEHGQEVWALNGAYDYLVDQGIRPDVHVILDARAQNVAFVENPSHQTRYLISSQCDPGVFDALEGHDVTVFHCASQGAEEIITTDTSERPINLLGTGTTVAMKAMALAELSGFTCLHLIGIDSCYMGEEHHSYPQSWNGDEMLIDVHYGDRDFKCAPWMIGQAQDFIAYIQRFTGTITIAGDGLLAHIARCGVPELAVDTRAREIVSRLPAKPLKGAEIGIFAGELSERLLASRDDLTLHMVDPWGDYEPSFIESEDFHAGLTPYWQEHYFHQTQRAVSRFNGRAVIHREKSTEAAPKIVEPLDFVFIDADHSYEGCRKDIEAWSPKIRPGGLLCGHDYDNVEYPQWGVKRAVDEYAEANRLELDLGDNFTWFIRTKGD